MERASGREGGKESEEGREGGIGVGSWRGTEGLWNKRNGIMMDGSEGGSEEARVKKREQGGDEGGRAGGRVGELCRGLGRGEGTLQALQPASSARSEPTQILQVRMHTFCRDFAIFLFVDPNFAFNTSFPS